MDLEKEIGSRIQDAIEAAGISLAKAARRADMSEGALRKIVRGEVSAQISSLARIADALGVSLHSIVCGWGKDRTVVRDQVDVVIDYLKEARKRMR